MDRSLPRQLTVIAAKAAIPVAATGRDLAPKLSGRLAGSVRPGGSQRGAVVRAGRGAVPYAGVIHFGWPRHNIRPQPFLYEAIDRRRDDVVRAYETGIRNLTGGLPK